VSRRKPEKPAANPAPAAVHGHRGQLILASLLLAAWLLFLAAMAVTA